MPPPTAAPRRLMPWDEEDLLIDRLLHGGLTPRPGEEQSLSDRLRPPYVARELVAGAEPATADAARMLEVGYHKLPWAYQVALAEAGRQPVDVGTMPDRGYTIAGMRTEEPAPSRSQLAGPAILSSSPRNMKHELIHEFLARRGNPLSSYGEEALAQIVTGGPRNPGTRLGSGDYEQAEAFDAELRRRYPEPTPPPEGLMQWLGSFIR